MNDATYNIPMPKLRTYMNEGQQPNSDNQKVRSTEKLRLSNWQHYCQHYQLSTFDVFLLCSKAKLSRVRTFSATEPLRASSYQERYHCLTAQCSESAGKAFESSEALCSKANQSRACLNILSNRTSSSKQLSGTLSLSHRTMLRISGESVWIIRSLLCLKADQSRAWTFSATEPLQASGYQERYRCLTAQCSESAGKAFESSEAFCARRPIKAGLEHSQQQNLFKQAAIRNAIVVSPHNAQNQRGKRLNHQKPSVLESQSKQGLNILGNRISSSKRLSGTLSLSHRTMLRISGESVWIIRNLLCSKANQSRVRTFLATEPLRASGYQERYRCLTAQCSESAGKAFESSEAFCARKPTKAGQLEHSQQQNLFKQAAIRNAIIVSPHNAQNQRGKRLNHQKPSVLESQSKQGLLEHSQQQNLFKQAAIRNAIVVSPHNAQNQRGKRLNHQKPSVLESRPKQGLNILSNRTSSSKRLSGTLSLSHRTMLRISGESVWIIRSFLCSKANQRCVEAILKLSRLWQKSQMQENNHKVPHLVT